MEVKYVLVRDMEFSRPYSAIPGKLFFPTGTELARQQDQFWIAEQAARKKYGAIVGHDAYHHGFGVEPKDVAIEWSGFTIWFKNVKTPNGEMKVFETEVARDFWIESQLERLGLPPAVCTIPRIWREQ